MVITSINTNFFEWCYHYAKSSYPFLFMQLPIYLQNNFCRVTFIQLAFIITIAMVLL